jgi:peptidoglycan/LPS O-acetylase OafA/YrhL
VPSSASGRIPSLDGLRAASIVLVLLGHLAGTRNFLTLSSLALFGDLGNLGVSVFFVISGYLITTLLLNEQALVERVNLGAFYARRAFRILPAAGTYLAVLALLTTVTSGVRLSSSDWLHALTFTMNYDQDRDWWVGHLWSLSVEEQFYLLWPAAIAVLGRVGGLWLAGSAVVIAPLWRVSVWVLWPDARESLGETFPTVMDAIAVGCVLAGSARWLADREWYRRILSPRPLAAIVGVVMGCNALGSHPWFSLPLGMTLRNLGIALIVHAPILQSNKPVASVLDRVGLRWLGRLSYSLYLWQQPFLNRHSHSTLAAFPINLGGAFVCAILSFVWIESPALRLRDRLASRTMPSRRRAPRSLCYDRPVPPI